MKKPIMTKEPAEQVVKDIRRATRKLHSSEKKAPRYYPAFVVRTAVLSFDARKVEEGRANSPGDCWPDDGKKPVLQLVEEISPSWPGKGPARRGFGTQRTGGRSRR